MRNKILAVLGLVVALAAAVVIFQPTSVVEAQQQLVGDEDGCWSGRSSGGQHCLVQSDSKWGDDDYLTVTYTNRCSDRLYVRFCNQRKDGSWDCGVDGIRPGSQKKWSTYKASGRTHANYTGSTKPMQDWVCAGKVPGWSDGP